MTVPDRYARLAPVPEGLPQALDTIATVLSRHPVRLAYVFGSATRPGARPHDVDLAVVPGSGFSWLDLYADLSLHLGTDRIDLADLSATPPEFQFEIVRCGRCLYARSDAERWEFERGVRMRLRDELPRLSRKHVALRARLAR